MRGHYGREIYNTFALAHELHRPVQEVARMTPAERTGWLAYFELRAEEARARR